MSSKMELGAVRLGHIIDQDEPGDVALVEFDKRGVSVRYPRIMNFSEAMEANTGDDDSDATVIFRDSGGYLTLLDGRSLGSTASSLGESEQRFRFWKALATGANGVDYASINGMRSDVDGLARWAKMSPVTSSLMYEDHERPSINIVAQNLPETILGGPLGLALTTQFWHKPQPVDGVFSIRTGLSVNTRSESLVAWEEHATAHRMIQDLMALVYGRPCHARLDSVMRADDQPTTQAVDKRYWVSAYVPSFGRQYALTPTLPDSVKPLFYLDETKAESVSAWLDEFDLWSRPTWIAVSSVFQPDLPIEVQLIQVSVALEALGYAIWAQKPTSGRTPAFDGLLREVTALVPLKHARVYGGQSEKSWRVRFINAYMGAKHADKPLPDSETAYQCVQQGLTLIRCWLALKLGVAPELLGERLSRV